MTTITALPPAPSDRTDPAVYNATANTWAAALPTWTTEVNAVGTEVTDNSTSAAIDAALSGTYAASASISANVSTASATLVNVLVWTSGTYAVGDPRYSPTDFQTYRCKVAGVRTIDPAIDPTNWVIVTALPAMGGQSGKVLSNNGTTPSWSSLPVAQGIGGRTITGNLTLTVTSGVIADAAISVTPTAPGLYVTLPVATTITTEGVTQISVYNAGDYDYGVKDSAGTQLGWVRPRTGAIIGLADNSTSAGVWAPYGLEKTGITASYVNSTVTNMGSTIRRIALDANRTCFLFGGTTCYAIVYDASTTTWGTATAITGTITSGAFVGVLSATDQVLVCRSSGTTNLGAATLTITGTSVSANAFVDVVLAGNYASFGQLIAVGSSFVVSYGRAATATCIRALTVSGTVPTIGAEAQLNPANTTPAILFASGSVVRTLACGSQMDCAPYTVSGSTLSAGTANFAAVTATAFRAFLNGNGNIVCHYINTTHYATIFKLTGTVEAASSVSLGTVTTSITEYNDYGVISASKTLFTGIVSGATWYANILTDTGGTASAGTQLSGALSGNVTPGIPVFSVVGSTAYVAAVTTAHSAVLTIDCSGASPTLTSAVTIIGGDTTSTAAYPKSTSIYGIKNPMMAYAGGALITFASYSNATNFNINGMRYSPSSITRIEPVPMAGHWNEFYGVTVSNTESYVNSVHTGTTGQIIQRIEAAA